MKVKLNALSRQQKIFSLPLLVAAAGYFVDIYDLLIFGIIRVVSLSDLGFDDAQITIVGERIIQFQMLGFLIGGVLWGVLGDKKGRLKVLYASIILYSLANIANAYVQTEMQYIVIRFIAGVGLAGELGAGVTLVAEILPKGKRGIATSLLTSFGILGACFAFLIKEYFDWRTCYLIGGGMGFMLLISRASIFESHLFSGMTKSNIKKGAFLMLFNNWDRCQRYLLSIAIGLPTWCLVGIYMTFSRELGVALNIDGEIDPARSILFGYAALSLGDLSNGLLSQWLKSRKKALLIFYILAGTVIFLFHTTLENGSVSQFYWFMAALGFSVGFWAVFVTVGAEQFGTNLRATAATSIPNMVRGALFFPIIPVYRDLLQNTFHLPILSAAAISAALWLGVACFSLIYLKESFHYDLDYLEK